MGSMDSTIRDHQFDSEDDDHIYLESEQVINLAMGLQNPIDIDTLKEAFCNCVLIKYPKFCSILVLDKSGKKLWKRTHVNVNDHIIIHHHPSPTTTSIIETSFEEYKEAAINTFLTNLSSSTPKVDQNKPLWKLHVLMDLNCLVLSVHHALGDDCSLMSMLSTCFGQTSDNKSKQIGYIDGYQNMQSTLERRNLRSKGVWELLQSIWLTFIYVLRIIGRVLWIKDSFSVIDVNSKAKIWPSKLVTAQYKLEDFWFIKTAIPYTTIYDVLLGVISCGLTKYLDLELPRERLKEVQHGLTAILKVNLHKDPTVLEKLEDMINTSSGSSSWGVRGDKTSTIILPIYCSKKLHPLEHVTVMKAIMNKKNMSYEANCIHIALNLMASCLSPKVASWFYQRALSNSTLLISTIKGPAEEMAITDNPVTYIRSHICRNPHAAITINMVSYAGRVDLQVMVAEEVIPNPQLLIKCFNESLLEMKSYSKLIHLLLGTGNPAHNSSDWFLYV